MFGFSNPTPKPVEVAPPARRKPLRQGASSAERADAWIRSVLGEDYDHISGQPAALSCQVTRSQIDAYYRRKVSESIECCALPEMTSQSSVPWFGSPLLSYLSIILRSTYQLTGEPHCLDSIAVRRYLSSSQFSLKSTILPNTMPTNLHPKTDVHPLPSGAHLHITCQILMVLGNTHPNQVFCPVLPDLIQVLLTFMTPAEAFAVTEVLVRKSLKSELYFPTTSSRWVATVRAAGLQLQKVAPQMSMHMIHMGIAPSQIIYLWLSRLFVGFLPIHTVHRFQDYFFLEGIYAQITLCITILTVYQDAFQRTSTKEHFLRVQTQVCVIDDVDGILKYCKQLNITKKLIFQYMSEVPQVSLFGEIRAFKQPSFKNVNRTGKSLVLQDKKDTNKFGSTGDKHLVSSEVQTTTVVSTAGVNLSLPSKPVANVWKGTCSEILTYTDFLCIREWLPLQQRSMKLVLSYSTSLQGYNQHDLLVQARSRPHILVVKHSKGILGSFVQKWQNGVFFDGRAFVFTLAPYIKQYPMNKAALVSEESDDSDDDEETQKKKQEKKEEVPGELAQFVKTFEDKDVRDGIWYRSGSMDVFGDVTVGGVVYNNSKSLDGNMNTPEEKTEESENVVNTNNNIAVPCALGYCPQYQLLDSPALRTVGHDAVQTHKELLTSMQQQYQLPTDALSKVPGSIVSAILAKGPKAPLYLEQLKKGLLAPTDTVDLPRYFFAFQEEQQPEKDNNPQPSIEEQQYQPRSNTEQMILCERIEPKCHAKWLKSQDNKFNITYKGYNVSHPLVTALCLVPVEMPESTNNYNTVYQHTLDTHIPCLGVNACPSSQIFQNATGTFQFVDLMAVNKKLFQLVLPSYKAIHTRAKVQGLTEQQVQSCTVPIGAGVRDDGFVFQQNELEDHTLHGAYGSQHGLRVGEIIHPADTIFLHTTAARCVHADMGSVPTTNLPILSNCSLATAAVVLSTNTACVINQMVCTQEDYLGILSTLYTQEHTLLDGLHALLDQSIASVLDQPVNKQYSLGSDSVYDVCAKSFQLESRYIPIVHTELVNTHPDQALPTLPDVLESPIDEDTWSQVVPINTVHLIGEIDTLYLLQTSVAIKTHTQAMHALLLPADTFQLQTYSTNFPTLRTFNAKTTIIEIIQSMLTQHTHVYITDAQGQPTHLITIQSLITTLVKVFEKLTSSLPSTNISITLPAKSDTIRSHMICTDKEIGLGDSIGMAFLLDEHLQQGYSQATKLFGNPALCGKDRFDIQAVECWTFSNED